MNKKSHKRVAVVGASGYAGGELMRYLLNHPEVDLGETAGHTQAGRVVTSVFPNLHSCFDGSFSTPDWERLAADNDLVFLCLPHGASQKAVKTLVKSGVRVVDLGADFRFSSATNYASTYGADHLFPELLSEAVYGLPELNREAIASARLVANPGCYPTASLLALLPVKGRLSSPVVVDAKSGLSGAGRGLKAGSLFAEVNENFQAYGVGVHRHGPEIAEKIDNPVLFTPHLVPMNRGILATVYLPLAYEECWPLYQEFYAEEPFVQLLEDTLPCTKAVSGTNFCHLAVRPAAVDGYTVVVSAIDNLGKGAAGSAVHNMNLLFGWPETTGLSQPALWP